MPSSPTSATPPLRLDRLQDGGGLIVTYACSAACSHCLYRSSGRRDHAYITPDAAAAACRTARRLGCATMHVGGGEPLLQPDALLRVLDAARQEGVEIEYVETNGSWFAEETAPRLLADLLRHGCRTLLLSMDPFHNAWVPFRKVKGVLAACRRAGMEVFPWRMEFFDEINRLDDSVPHPMKDYEAAYGKEYLPRLLARYHATPGGRALDTLRPFLPRQAAAAWLAVSRPCANLLRTSHFHLDLYGNYVPPGCVGLAVPLADLDKPLDPERQPALHRLATAGVSGLAALAATRGFTANPEGYVSACDLCADLRRWLAITDARGEFPDLAPAEFYRMP